MTPFGTLSRKLRLERQLLLGDVASSMGFGASFISQVEAGGKRIPDGFVDKMAKALSLTELEKSSLVEAAAISAPTYILSIGKNADQLDRELAHQLQLGFARLDDSKKRRLLVALKEAADGQSQT